MLQISNEVAIADLSLFCALIRCWDLEDTGFSAMFVTAFYEFVGFVFVRQLGELLVCLLVWFLAWLVHWLICLLIDWFMG